MEQEVDGNTNHSRSPWNNYQEPKKEGEGNRNPKKNLDCKDHNTVKIGENIWTISNILKSGEILLQWKSLVTTCMEIYQEVKG